MITPEDITHLAALARLRLTDQEKLALEKDLEGILAYVKELEQVDLTSVDTASLNAYLPKNVLRPDADPQISGEQTEGLLAAAPKREGDYVKVKKIL